jgi:hypothetical protein
MKFKVSASVTRWLAAVGTACAASVAAGSSVPDRQAQAPLFERVEVPGITDLKEGMNGVALADLNRDGRTDIVAVFAQPRIQTARRPWAVLRVFLNEGGFRFRKHDIQIDSDALSGERFGPRAQIPVLADFNNDGRLDMLVTRDSPMDAGKLLGKAKALGNTLLVTKERWDHFVDASAQMGIRNEQAYNRQAAFGDVNGDGWLDIAIGSDNIGNAHSGLPISRLYVFVPKGPRFEDGTFKDIGGTSAVPDFGGFYHDSSRDRAGPDINLVDLDNDGDLDLLQSSHVDCRAPLLPYSPCEYRQGMFVWRNMLRETGHLQFVPQHDNGLASVGQLRFDKSRGSYRTVAKAPGLAYVSLGDVNNDGLLDVVAVGPSDPGWSPRAEYVGGEFWDNLGNFRFRQATQEAGLGALNWVYRQWYAFEGLPVPQTARRQPRAMEAQPGLTQLDPMDSRPYYGDAVFGDFDNDGWLDLVLVDRRGRSGIDVHALLFMNRGDGTFEPRPTTFSGLNATAINAEATDFDNDGLLDLILASDPDNSSHATTLDEYHSAIYRNTGRDGARSNHWLRLRFRGINDAELIGTRVEYHAPDGGRLLGMRMVSSKQSYKSSTPLEAHVGLGRVSRVDVTVTLPGGRTRQFAGLDADRFLELDLTTGAVTVVRVTQYSR